MTTSEAAERLGIKPVTVRAAIRRGRLAARKYGRDWSITPAALRRYQDDHLGRPGRPKRRA